MSACAICLGTIEACDCEREEAALRLLRSQLAEARAECATAMLELNRVVAERLELRFEVGLLRNRAAKLEAVAEAARRLDSTIAWDAYDEGNEILDEWDIHLALLALDEVKP